MRRPIVQAAVSTIFFEKARVHRSHARIRLNDAQLRGSAGLPFTAIGITSTVRNYTLIDVVLDADTGLLFQDQLVIPETSYFVPKGTVEGQAIQRAGLVSLDADEDIIIGYNNVHAGYQHWLTQCVPAIDWALRQERTRAVRLVLPALAAWQEDILDILGYRNLPRLMPKPGTFYRLPHAEYSEFLNGKTSFGVCLSAPDTARRILDRLVPTEFSCSVLFVPCSNPY